MTDKIRSKRGIYLLPSVLTTFGMFAGFYSIISSINGDFTIAAISILIAMFWDTLDGRVARLTNTQSETQNTLASHSFFTDDPDQWCESLRSINQSLSS